MKLKKLIHDYYVDLEEGLKEFRGSFLRNVLSLYSIQLCMYLIPLITLPYLVRVLGPEEFGIVAFGQGVVIILTILVNYGFDLSATREVAKLRHNKQSINNVAMSVWASKFLLTVMSFSILVALIIWVEKIKIYQEVLVLLFGIVIGSALLPTWLYQGLEKLPSLLFIDLLVRFAGITIIFLEVRCASDGNVYASILSLQSVATSSIAIWIAYRRFNIRFQIPQWHEIWVRLHNGWALFLSTASISLYTAGNAVLLGILVGPTSVGYYSGAEKIVRIGSSVLGPISQTAYPKSSQIASTSEQLALKWAQKLIIVMTSFGFIVSVFLIVLAHPIVNVVLGNPYEPSIIVLRLLGGTIVLKSLSNVLGVQVMLPLGYDKAYLSIFIITGLLNVSLALIFVRWWNECGMAFSVLISELFVVLAQLFYLRRKSLLGTTSNINRQ